MTCRFDIDALAEEYDRTIGYAARQWVSVDELIDRAYIGRQVSQLSEVADFATLQELRAVLGPPDPVYLRSSVNRTNDGFCYLGWFPIEYWPFLAGQLKSRPTVARLSLAMRVFGIEHPHVEYVEGDSTDSVVHALPIGSLAGFKLEDCDEVVQVGSFRMADPSHVGHGATFAADGYGRAMVSGCSGQCSALSECAFVHVRDHFLRGCVRHRLPVVRLENGGLSRADRQQARSAARLVTGEISELADYHGLSSDIYRRCASECVFPFLNGIARRRRMLQEMEYDVWDSDDEYQEHRLIERLLLAANVKMAVPPDLRTRLVRRQRAASFPVGEFPSVDSVVSKQGFSPGVVPYGLFVGGGGTGDYDPFGLQSAFLMYSVPPVMVGTVWDVGLLGLFFPRADHPYPMGFRVRGYDLQLRRDAVVRGREILRVALGKPDGWAPWDVGESVSDESMFKVVVSAVLRTSFFSVVAVPGDWSVDECCDSFMVLVRGFYLSAGMAAVKHALAKFNLEHHFAGRVH